MNTQTERVLPADVYDTLEFSALVYGGMGHSVYVDKGGQPCCAQGHAMVADEEGECWGAVQKADIRVGINDAVFQPGEDRIAFKTWCKRLNVVRGS